MKVPEHNKVSIWKPIPIEGLDIRPHSNYNLIKDGKIQVAEKAFRYAKNYKKGNKKFSLLMVSTNGDVNNIESFLDKTKRKVKSDFSGKLEQTDFEYKD